MIKAIIFDIDGTLIDSFHRNLNFYRSIFTEGGVPNFPTEEIYRPVFHLPLKECLEHLSPDKSPEAIERLFSIYKNIDPPTEKFILMPNAVETVKQLHGNYKLGIVTSRYQLSTAQFLEEADLEQYFSAVIHHGLYEKPKPNAEPLLLAIEELDIKPEEAVYVGDAQIDIDAAHAAGLKAILYNYDHTNNQNVQDADKFIMDHTELAAAVESMITS